MSVIAIDFDDTIHDTKHVMPGYKMGQPIPGAVEAVNKLVAQGHEVYILTASGAARRDSIRGWLDYFNFPPLRISSEKTKADVYLDDRGLHFTNWSKALADIAEMTNGQG